MGSGRIGRPPITPERIEILRAAFRAGETLMAAAKLAGVSHPSAWKYFQRFAAEGIVGSFRRLKIEAPLRAAFERGLSQREAKLDTGISTSTCGRYFRRFAAEGVERRPRLRGLPYYVGPEWIGSPIT